MTAQGHSTMFVRWAGTDGSGNDGMLIIHWPVLYNITGLVTQQRLDATQYLKTYSLQYTRDGVTWLDHVDDDGNTIIYPALHTDYHQKTLMEHRAEIIARGLRIQVVSFEGVPRLLLDLVGYALGKYQAWRLNNLFTKTKTHLKGWFHLYLGKIMDSHLP